MITLKQAPQVLEDVVVTARRRRLEAVGYYLRRDSGKGRFIEGDSLASIHRINFMRALTLIGASMPTTRLRWIRCRVALPAGVDFLSSSTGGQWEEMTAPSTCGRCTLKASTQIEIYEDAGMPAVDRNLSTQAAVKLGPDPTPTSTFTTPPRRMWANLVRTASAGVGASRATPTSCVIVVWERY